jgi:RNA polymerase sigma factor (sigma-70 family)
VAGYVSTVARNGLLDFLRRSRRRTAPLNNDAEDGGALMEGMDRQQGQPAPDVIAAGRCFARALCDCVSHLDPRTRLVWFLRVFHELSARDIAAHPEIDIRPGHVNVLLQRGRSSVKQCMRRKGYEARDMPPGTFLELWKAFRLEPGGDMKTPMVQLAVEEQEAPG